MNNSLGSSIFPGMMTTGTIYNTYSGTSMPTFSPLNQTMAVSYPNARNPPLGIPGANIPVALAPSPLNIQSEVPSPYSDPLTYGSNAIASSNAAYQAGIENERMESRKNINQNKEERNPHHRHNENREESSPHHKVMRNFMDVFTSQTALLIFVFVMFIIIIILLNKVNDLTSMMFNIKMHEMYASRGFVPPIAAQPSV